MLLLRTEKDEENVSESLHLVFLIKWILLDDIMYWNQTRDTEHF